MANDGFNGSTVLFASVTLGDLRGIDYSETAAMADCSASDDTQKIYETGIPDAVATIDFVGGVPSVGVGSKGALAINWFDGATDNITLSVITDVGTKGVMDDEITSQIKVVPSTAA